MSYLLLLSLLTPLLATLFLSFNSVGNLRFILAALSPLPAFLLSLYAPIGTSLELESLLLGSRLGVDDIAKTALFFTSFVWLMAGFFTLSYMKSDRYRVRFWIFFLLTQTGNLGVCLAQDSALFYLFFSVMTFGAYGIIVHSLSQEALKAGRLYMIMALIGEVLLLAGMLYIYALNGTHYFLTQDMRSSTVATLLIFIGFGIKVGVPLLHFWLPPAHSSAPAPASAVLSGVLLKAGLIGWFRFLPLGGEGYFVLGAMAFALGVVGMFGGAILGILQTSQKRLLAYSSISQMGFITIGVGAILIYPEIRGEMSSALLFYAAHHAFAKSGLFLGVGLGLKYRLDFFHLTLLLLLALSVVGTPFTSGAFAKNGLKEALGETKIYDLTLMLLWVGAVGSTLLMIRLARLIKEDQKQHKPSVATNYPLLITTLASIALPYIILGDTKDGGTLYDLLPAISGAIIYAVFLKNLRTHTFAPPQFSIDPPPSPLGVFKGISDKALLRIDLTGTIDSMKTLESNLARWSIIGLTWLAMLIIFIL